jgi:hypothetical protein
MYLSSLVGDTRTGDKGALHHHHETEEEDGQPVLSTADEGDREHRETAAECSCKAIWS